jgi:DNA topoisomerase-1
MTKRGRRRAGVSEESADPAASSIVYVSDALIAGISRRRHSRGFSYYLPDGRILRDHAELARIRKLAIPPAYSSVWICPLSSGHLQATGRDARGRKQYRYHPEWNAQRDADKFSRLKAFGEALPQIRRRVARDLARDDGCHATHALVVATIVRLLDTTFVRIGNAEYARANHSYGLTTLREAHAHISGSRLRLRFRGKSGVIQEVSVDDKRVARIVRRCQQLPGQELFQYESDGELHKVGSGDVNDYLCEAAGERFTAKDFRTWHATALALELIRNASTGAAAMSHREILAEVARRLGNTAAVCRKSYIHPAVLHFGETVTRSSPEAARAPKRDLSAAETRLLAFLESDDSRLGASPSHPVRAAPGPFTAASLPEPRR